MNKYLVGIIVLLAGIVGFLSLHKVKVAEPLTVTPPQGQLAGAAAGPYHYNKEYFVKLGYIGALSTSSSSPAAYGTSASFQMVVPASATVGSASTTAVTSLSNRVFIQQSRTSGIAGTTCNTAAIATGTVTSLVASSTSLSLNGLIITVPAAPVTNPYCFDVTIFE